MNNQKIAERIFIANMGDKEALDVILTELKEKNKEVATFLEKEMLNYEEKFGLCPQCWSDDIESKIFCRASINEPEEWTMKCNECGTEL